jgi:hypothetical protein
MTTLLSHGDDAMYRQWREEVKEKTSRELARTVTTFLQIRDATPEDDHAIAFAYMHVCRNELMSRTETGTS